MQCADFELNWDAWQEGLLDAAGAGEMQQHLEGCQACRQYVEVTRTLRSRLAAWSLPPAHPGFAQGALRRARHWGRRRQWAARSALAAGVLAAAVLVGVRWGFSMQRPVATVILVPRNGERTVTLALDAQHQLRDVSFELRVPANVELQGYPGQRDLRWTGGLKAGRNGLSLPLRAESDGDGILVARISHRGQMKEIRVRLRVPRDGNTPSASSGNAKDLRI